MNFVCWSTVNIVGTDDYGIQVYELSDQELQAFKDKAAPIYDQYKEIMGEDLYKAFGLE